MRFNYQNDDLEKLKGLRKNERFPYIRKCLLAEGFYWPKKIYIPTARNAKLSSTQNIYEKRKKKFSSLQKKLPRRQIKDSSKAATYNYKGILNFLSKSLKSSCERGHFW